MPDTDYPSLREALDDRWSALTDAELDSAFGAAFGEDVTAAEYEEFFGSIGKALSSVAQQAAPYVGTAVQGALQGASTGAALGPYGALAGALAGGTGAVLQKHTTGTARDVGSVIGGVLGTAGALSGGARPVAAGAPLGGPAAAPATNQLLQLLARPETAQALAALLGGSNAAIPTGPAGTPVPAGRYAGALSALAGRAEAEAFGLDEFDEFDEFDEGYDDSFDEGFDEAFDQGFHDAFDELVRG